LALIDDPIEQCRMEQCIDRRTQGGLVGTVELIRKGSLHRGEILKSGWMAVHEFRQRRRSQVLAHGVQGGLRHRFQVEAADLCRDDPDQGRPSVGQGQQGFSGGRVDGCGPGRSDHCEDFLLGQHQIAARHHHRVHAIDVGSIGLTNRDDRSDPRTGEPAQVVGRQPVGAHHDGGHSRFRQFIRYRVADVLSRTHHHVRSGGRPQPGQDDILSAKAGRCTDERERSRRPQCGGGRSRNRNVEVLRHD
jgi:hypothetical protein